MKKIFDRTLIWVAASLALGTAVYGQDKITANIPFAFRTADGLHSAGVYDVLTHSGAVVLQLRSPNGHSVNLPLGIPETSGIGEDRPRLVFNCKDDGGCSLAQVWTGNGKGWSYSAPVAKSETAVVVYYGGEAAK